MKSIVILLVVAIALAKARHIHPGSGIKHNMDDIPTEIEGLPIEVIKNLKPSRFVPINNVLFFKAYEPCEDGMKRDLLGVCREVWNK